MPRLTVKNYRCFVAPATINITPGFTAFVGVNNAGKSALLRLLVEFRGLFISAQSSDYLIHFLHAAPNAFYALQHVGDPEEVFSNLNERSIEITIEFDEGDDEGGISSARFVIERSLITSLHVAGPKGPYWFPPERTFLNASEIGAADGTKVNFAPLIGIMKVLSETLYIGPFRNIINVGANQSYFDIQIGDAFVAQFRELKTGPNKRNSMGMQKLIEDIQKIFEFRSLSIDPSHDNHSLHIAVNGKPFKQHELGSGLSQFIVVLANAAIKRPSLILIDEPELNLHPRLQLDFLTALGSYASYGVWFSSHSLGLARSSAERIYSVRKIGDGNSAVAPLEGTVRASETLGELSFSTQKELGVDKILLVEGPTEVKVIQQLLRMRGKDHKVVLLPVHGHMPDEVELDELLRISSNIAGLIDSERVAEGAALDRDRKEMLALFQRKGLKLHVLERRAMENYFSDAEIKRAFGETFRALGPFEKLSEVQPHWSKNQNWKLAAGSAPDIAGTDLGKFLDNL